MWSFEIDNVITGETRFIFGYWFEDACRRSKLNPDEWNIIQQDYED